MKRDARLGVPSYTYRQEKTEEKLILRRLTIIGGVTLVLLIIIWFWGLTFIRIIGALGTKGEEAVTTDLEIPLIKPAFSDIPEFTIQDKITVAGTTTAGVEVVLYVNGTQISKTVTDTSGVFSFIDVALKEGLNLIKVTATNKKGEISDEKAVVTLDKQPPNIVVSEPKEGQTFSQDTKTITIKGSTEAEATVFINSIQAILDQNGNFSFSLGVNPGQNKIEIQTKDQAGNTKTLTLTITVAQSPD